MEKEILELLKDIKQDIYEIKNNQERLEKRMDIIESNIIDLKKELVYEKVNFNKRESLASEKDLIPEVIPIFNKLKFELDNIKFKTWIDPTLSKAYVEDNILVIPCTNRFMKTILEERFLKLFEEISSYPIRLTIGA